MNIYFNAHNSTGLKFNIPPPKKSKEAQKLQTALNEVKQLSLTDLHNFLTEDHTSFSVLSAQLKNIPSTNRTTVTLSKNSAKVFYLGKTKTAIIATQKPFSNLSDDCLTDAQNCDFFKYFNRAERRHYLRFIDKTESNFESTAIQQPILFLTLTFNTTHNNYWAFTTNTDPTDLCWQPLANHPYLKDWAQSFDPNCEPMKVHIQKVAPEIATNYERANQYVTKFLRDIHLKWKPKLWKWVVVPELQKNGNWHFHLLSTPIVPYAHKCTLDKDFKSCWNCRAYISTLWKWGRVESKSPGKKPISKYLAKYLSKSFHLRSLYRQHGFAKNAKAYRFFLNLYDYDERQVIVQDQHKIDPASGAYLAPNQHVFRKSDYTYYYRTNEWLVGKVANPLLIKKNYRLGTRSLNPCSLLNLAKKSACQESLLLQKPPKIFKKDFQEFMISFLLKHCTKAEFLKIPLEQEQVPKAKNGCDGSPVSHFQTKLALRFSFKPTKAELIKTFFKQLDDYANEFDMVESQDFYTYPPQHDTKHETILQLGVLCGCEVLARNQYLNNWQLNYCYV